MVYYIIPYRKRPDFIKYKKSIEIFVWIRYTNFIDKNFLYDYYIVEKKVKEKHFHSEVCFLRMNASTHSQNIEANYESNSM